MSYIDLAFTVRGTLPVDHGYSLFSALSKVVPQLHGQTGVGIHPIRGQRVEAGTILLSDKSRLRFRLPTNDLVHYVGLAGTTLELAGHHIEIGFPKVEPLVPAANLISRLVTFKGGLDPETFEGMAHRQLAERSIAGKPCLIPSTREPWVGQPLRRVLHIKGRRIVGYALVVAGLTAEESLLLQEHGLGGRRRMGCGVFVSIQGRV